MYKAMKTYYLVTLLVIAFAPFAFSQEEKVKDSADTTITEGYQQIEKMKSQAVNRESESTSDEYSEETVDEEEVVPKELYELQKASSKPLYDPTGKRDPFKPFIQAPREEEVVITEATPPLKKYDLNEFRITGIVWVGNEPKAMIVDPEGNTYFLGKGNEIGNRNGEIIEVRENGLLVREKRFFEDVFGNRKVEVKNSVLAFVDEDE